MFTVRFVSHVDKVEEMLNRKLLAAIKVASETLAEGYRKGLQRKIAPPHSQKGQIPYAYAGHKDGGFGPVNGVGKSNNTPAQGFARSQKVGTDFLSNYISGSASGLFGSIDGWVGFRNSHVISRNKNYLLRWDATTRPWVIPLFNKYRKAITRNAKQAFENTR